MTSVVTLRRAPIRLLVFLAIASAAAACFFELPALREGIEEGADGGDATPTPLPDSGTPVPTDDAGSCDAWVCEPFDDPVFEARWTPLRNSGGTLAVTAEVTGAPSNKLIALTPRSDDAGTLAAAIRSNTQPPPYRRARFSYDLLFDDATLPTGHAHTGYFSIGSAFAISILLRPDGAMELVERQLVDGGLSFPVLATLGTMPKDIWRRFTLDITLPGDAGAGKVSVLVDGAPAADQVAIKTPAVPNAEHRFTVGLASVQAPTGNWIVHVDNVRVELE